MEKAADMLGWGETHPPLGRIDECNACEEALGGTDEHTQRRGDQCAALLNCRGVHPCKGVEVRCNLFVSWFFMSHQILHM